jgi:hypothetical protein
MGVLKGSRFSGGSRRGCRFFFFAGIAFGFCSTSEAAPTLLFL